MGGSSSTGSQYATAYMPQVRLSARAQSDIARLHSFLLSKNAKAAQRATQTIRASFSSLARFFAFGVSCCIKQKAVAAQRTTLDPGLRRDDGRDFMVTATSTAINCI